MKKRLDDEIKQELLELNFRPSSIGLVYWIEAIRYQERHMLTYEMMDIYDFIAKKYKVSVTHAERNMRYAMETAKKKIQVKYHYHDKINAQVFLGLIRFKLI